MKKKFRFKLPGNKIKLQGFLKVFLMLPSRKQHSSTSPLFNSKAGWIQKYPFFSSFFFACHMFGHYKELMQKSSIEFMCCTKTKWIFHFGDILFCPHGFVAHLIVLLLRSLTLLFPMVKLCIDLYFVSNIHISIRTGKWSNLYEL